MVSSPILAGQTVTAAELNNIPVALDVLTFSSVTNTVTETVIGTFPLGIPAGDAVANSGYQFSLTFSHDCSGTPTVQYRLYMASIAAANIIFDSTVLNMSGTHTFQACGMMAFMVCTNAGVAGTFDSYGFCNFNNTSQGDADFSETGHTINTTVANQIILTCKWGTASASNTARTTGGVMRRS